MTTLKRAARLVVVVPLWLVVTVADRVQGVDPPARLSTGLRWAWTGENQRPTTVAHPAYRRSS